MRQTLLRTLRRGWFAIREQIFLSRHGARAERFGAIYRDRMWQNPETASGFGSTLAATGQLRRGLNDFFRRNDIASWLDAPCGDANWQPHVRFSGRYTGIDIVPDMIAANRERIDRSGWQFEVRDIVSDALPAADLVLCRECMNHLPLDDGVRALANLERAAGKFLLVTDYPQCRDNAQQPASFRYRPLNLTLAPFGLRTPDAWIDEDDHEPGKRIAIWRLDAGPLRAQGTA